MMFTERNNPKTQVAVLQDLIPSVIISQNALAKMKVYVDTCADEVGWLGTAVESNNLFFIKDVMLFDQEVHATTTEITPEGLMGFAEALLQQPNGMDVWNEIKVWGHSHVNMAVSPSGQDDLQMRTFKDGGHDWFIRIIANKKGDLKVDIYNYKQGLTYLDVPWEMYEAPEMARIKSEINRLKNELDALNTQYFTNIKEPIQEEMKVKVRKKSSVVSHINTNNNHNKNRGKNGTVGGGTSSFGNRDSLETYDDVIKYFDVEELQEIGMMDSYTEVAKHIELLGFTWSFFSYNDKQKIWAVARQVAKQIEGGLLVL